jgi:hypothetical protein
MAEVMTLLGGGRAIHYGKYINRCRSCGADLDDFLSFDFSGEILRCLVCNEEVPIEDISISGSCYRDIHSLIIRCQYYEREDARRIWRKSWRRTPK